MLKDYYDILGVSEYATDREISEAYFALRKKYLEERFSEGEKGNEAAKKLTQIDNAYEEIKRFRSERADSGDLSLLKQVDEALKVGDLSKAQTLLDSFDQRGAEWHYLQSVVFYKKTWMNECKKQLEIAMALDENNKKYKDTYNRLLEKMNASAQQQNNNQSWNSSGSGNPNDNRIPDFDEPQMGGDSCMDFCCRMAICNMCLNCCCNLR